MRDKLRERLGARSRFRGVFERFGEKSGWRGRIEYTVLFRDVRDESGNLVTDHLWFNLTKGFSDLYLTAGDKVTFDARVRKYVKGYQGEDPEKESEHPLEVDYKLSHPTKILKE